MPIFEYRCGNCGDGYDVLHKGAENVELIKCPSCGSREHIKKFSSFSSAAGIASQSAFDGGCATASCGMPSYGSCASGMCGLE